MTRISPETFRRVEAELAVLRSQAQSWEAACLTLAEEIGRLKKGQPSSVPEVPP